MLFLTCTEIIVCHINDTAMSVLLWMQMPDLSDCTMERKSATEENENFKTFFIQVQRSNKTLVASLHLKLYVFLRHSMQIFVLLHFRLQLQLQKRTFWTNHNWQQKLLFEVICLGLLTLKPPARCLMPSHHFIRSVIQLWNW